MPAPAKAAHHAIPAAAAPPVQAPAKAAHHAAPAATPPVQTPANAAPPPPRAAADPRQTPQQTSAAVLDLLASSKKTYWTLEPSEYRPFRSVCACVVAGYVEAGREERAAIWRAFLAIPKTHLLKGEDGAGARRKKRTENTPFSPQNAAHAALRTKVAVPRKFLAAETLARAGHLSKAAAACLREDLPALCHEDAITRLQALHPAGVRPSPTRPTPPPSLLGVDPAAFKIFVSRGRKAKAPGPSGWTEELLWVACGHPTVACNVRQMCLDAANGDVDEAVSDLLRASRLVAIPKRDGGVRPLAVGEALGRLAAKLVLAPLKPSLLNVFGSLQACLERAGAERIVHEARAALASGRTVLALDMRNAFNSVDRTAILEAVTALEPRLLRAAETGYLLPSRLFFAGSELVSSKGVRQGDVLGPVFFSLAIHGALLQVQKSFPRVHVRAYLDDVTLFGNGADLVAAAQMLEKLLENIGLLVNSAKCGVIGPDAHFVFNALGVPAPTSLRILGAFLGPDPEVMAAVLERQTDQTALLGSIDFLEPSIRLAIIRFCAHPRLNFLVRTHPAELMASPCLAFDEAILAAVLRLLGVPRVMVDIAHLTLMCVPLKNGGLGLRSYTQLAPLAYAASSDPTSDAQDVLTATLDQENCRIVDADPELARIRGVYARPGAGLWLSPPTTTSPRWQASEFAVALQQRLNIGTCSLISPPAQILCDCGHTFGCPEWHLHVVSCAAKKGRNISTTSRIVNDIVHETARTCAPATFPLRSPPVSVLGCPEVMADLLVTVGTGDVYVDWTIVNVLGRSGPTVARAEARKARTYATATVPVITAAFEITGAPSAPTRAFLRQLEAFAPAINARELERALADAIQQNSARIIVDARRRRRLHTCVDWMADAATADAAQCAAEDAETVLEELEAARRLAQPCVPIARHHVRPQDSGAPAAPPAACDAASALSPFPTSLYKHNGESKEGVRCENSVTGNENEDEDEDDTVWPRFPHPADTSVCLASKPKKVVCKKSDNSNTQDGTNTNFEMSKKKKSNATVSATTNMRRAAVQAVALDYELPE